ncbi:hypothetical protein J6590_018938 [Homalodisca vitripennis]|nr:hypothetical protein J6590_018938 [Homalodisca vitripennis]
MVIVSALYARDHGFKSRGGPIMEAKHQQEIDQAVKKGVAVGVAKLLLLPSPLCARNLRSGFHSVFTTSLSNWSGIVFELMVGLRISLHGIIRLLTLDCLGSGSDSSKTGDKRDDYLFIYKPSQTTPPIRSVQQKKDSGHTITIPNLATVKYAMSQ